MGKARKKIRIVTLNAHFGKNDAAIVRAFDRNQNLSEADVILLQEIEEHEHEGAPRPKKIADALKMEYVYAPSRMLTDTSTHGLAILSKFSLANFETIKLPAYRIRFGTRSRIGMLVTIAVDKTKIRIANVHLDTRINSDDRILQIEPILKHLEKFPKSILGGDFNLLPFRFRQALPISLSNQKKYMHEHLTKNGFDGYCENTDHTFKRGFIRFELDAIYAKGLKIKNCGVEKLVRVSDHHPLWVDVDF